MIALTVLASTMLTLTLLTLTLLILRLLVLTLLLLKLSMSPTIVSLSQGSPLFVSTLHFWCRRAPEESGCCGSQQKRG